MARLLLVLFFSVISLFGENFTVTTTAELRQALKVASENNQSDTIILQSGLYSVIDDGVGLLEYNVSNDDNLTLIGADNNVTLSGEKLSQILKIDTQGTVILAKLNFINGKVEDTGGGAVYIKGNLIIQDCNFTNNSASGNWNGDGGAVYGGDDSNITIANSTFTNNSASGYEARGGAVSG
ncbi:MAG TPA: hypothetical protein EYG60_00005, partial [Campylobacterales bacterium]|nr:hypothetical protein [Campylobacterales bacterium]